MWNVERIEITVNQELKNVVTEGDALLIYSGFQGRSVFSLTMKPALIKK